MFHKNYFKTLLMMLVLLLVVGGTFNQQPVQAEGEIAIVFATGGLGDKSFNDSAYRGIQEAEEKLGISFNYAEPSAIAEYETYIKQFAQTRRYDLIISIGFDQADALSSVASSFPDQNFALIDAVVEAPNVGSYVYKEKERGFLMGVAAAMMTTRTDDEFINEDKVIGVIGGMKIPLIDANIAGYIKGAKYIEPDIEVKHSYVGSWQDSNKAKELALSMIEDNADIIWQAAGRSGLGVIKAAAEEDKYAIGADSDQGHEAPDHILTNGMKFVDNTVFLAVEQVLNDNFEAGITSLGIEKGGIGYTDSLLPEPIINKLEEVKAKITAGEIEIPEKIEEAR